MVVDSPWISFQRFDGLAALALLAASIALLVVWWRGRAVEGGVRCRACGFDLRGRPEGSERCSECGAELGGPRAIVRVTRERDARWLGGAALAIVLLVGLLGWRGWVWASEVDWLPYYPVSWVMDDYVNGVGGKSGAALRELQRRVNDPETSQEQIDWLADLALAAQADRSKPWDPNLVKLVAAIATNERLSPDRIERLITQSVRLELEMKPVLRRGAAISLSRQLSFDRLPWEVTIVGPLTVEPVMLGPAELIEGRTTSDRWTGGGYSASRRMPEMDDEVKSSTARTGVRGTAQLMGRNDTPLGEPVDIAVTRSIDVKIAAADATVDEFMVVDAERDTMRAAVDARFRRGRAGELRLEVWTGKLPVAVAMEVVVVYGVREQVVGTIRVEKGGRPRWHALWRQLPDEWRGVADIHLRPAQEAADSARTLGQYWGEPIVLSGIEIDKPYSPPFVLDETIREAVEKTITLTVERGSNPGALGVTVTVDAPPIRLMYEVRVKQSREKHPHRDVSCGPGESISYGMHVDGVAPDATHVDVVLEPDRFWESKTNDLASTPWGGVVVFENVEIGGGAVGPTPGGGAVTPGEGG